MGVLDDLEDLYEQGKDVVQDVGEAAQDLAEDAVDLGREAIDKAEEIADDAVDLGKEIAREIGDEAEEIGKDILEGAEDLAEKAEEIGKDIAEDIADVAQDVAEGAKDIGEGIAREASDLWDFARKIGEGILEGDFSEEGSWGGVIGQTIIGFTPVGWIADIRDFAAAVRDVATGEAGWMAIVLAGIGFLPGGDTVKGAARMGKKAGKAADVAKGAGNAADAAKGAGNAAGTARHAGGAAPASRAGDVAQTAARARPQLVQGNYGRLSGDTAGTGGIKQIRGQRMDDGSVQIMVKGDLAPSLDRKAATTPNYNERLRSPSDVGLPGYERAHLWGPGFGDEARDGIMYAPSAVNQQMQAHAIESKLSAVRDTAVANGFPATVTVTGRSFPPPLDNDPMVLQKVTYRVEVQVPGEATPRTVLEYELDVPPPGRPITRDDIQVEVTWGSGSELILATGKRAGRSAPAAGTAGSSTP